MPKDRVGKSSYFDQSRKFPYPCSSNNADKYKSKIPLPLFGDEKEWEEARCPVCMEHPHNAVLLLCSSHEKGCRPYMCDTSYRHSNCLDQFHKSSHAAPSSDLHEDVVPLPNATYRSGIGELRSRSTSFHGRQKLKLMCPLCRGHISGWVVIKPARQFMNYKQRSCSLETCDFSGNYLELRRHARLEHPSVRPSEADPRRQRDWETMEQQNEFEDFPSAYQMESFRNLWSVDFILGELDETIDLAAFSSEFDSSEDSVLSHLDHGIILSDYDLWDWQEALSIDDTEESDNEGSEDGSLLTVIQPELPFLFWEPLFYMAGIDSSAGGGRSFSRRSRRSIARRRSRPRYHTENAPATRRGSNSTSGGLGEHRQANRGRSRSNN